MAPRVVLRAPLDGRFSAARSRETILSRSIDLSL